MKVIKHDINVSDWKFRLTCYTCKTELEAVVNDIKYSGEPGDWHDPGWERYEVTCPECSTTLEIPSDQIHNLIKARVQKNNKKWF